MGYPFDSGDHNILWLAIGGPRKGLPIAPRFQACDGHGACVILDRPETQPRGPIACRPASGAPGCILGAVCWRPWIDQTTTPRGYLSQVDTPFSYICQMKPSPMKQRGSVPCPWASREAALDGSLGGRQSRNPGSRPPKSPEPWKGRRRIDKTARCGVAICHAGDPLLPTAHLSATGGAQLGSGWHLARDKLSLPWALANSFSSKCLDRKARVGADTGRDKLSLCAQSISTT